MWRGRSGHYRGPFGLICLAYFGKWLKLVLLDDHYKGRMEKIKKDAYQNDTICTAEIVENRVDNCPFQRLGVPLSPSVWVITPLAWNLDHKFLHFLYGILAIYVKQD